MTDQSLLSLRDVFAQILAFVPALAAGLLVLVVGFVVAWLCARVILRISLLLRLDRVVARLGWGGLARGDIRHTLFRLVGGVIGALVFLIFLDNAFVIWHLTVLSRLLERLVLVIPNLLVAGIILLVGTAVAAAVARAVRTTLAEEEVERASLFAKIARAAVLTFAVALALLHLNVGNGLVIPVFLVTFGALALAFALAVGLGSRRAVERMWDGLLPRHGREEAPSDDGPNAT
jgi:hypothetical protein